MTSQTTESSDQVVKDQTNIGDGRAVQVEVTTKVVKSSNELAEDRTDLYGYSPRTVGLFLTGLGTVAMVAGTVEYFQRLKMLREYHTVKTWRASLVMAVIMSATGLFVFLSIVAKLL